MNLAGVFAPIPTPFDDRDRLDVARLRTAFPHWLATPLSGFVVLGTNGEVGLMEDDECDRVVEEARALVPRRRLLIAGAGRESTRATVRAARRAADCGADAVLIRTPSWFKAQMTSEAFHRHFSAVADSSPVPVLLYNFAAATGVNLRPETAARLAEHPNIVGMKESSGDIAQLSELIALTPDDFPVLAGSGSTFYAALCAGASGGILVLGTVLPDACVELFDLAQKRHYDEARRLQRRLAPIARLLSTEYGVPSVKAALALVGCDCGQPRPPLMPAAESAVAQLKEALATFKEAIA